MKVLIVILVMLGAPLMLGVGALLLNRPPLFSPPGVLERLRVYLTENRVCTAPDQRFPELRPKPSALSPERLMQDVDRALASLGWKVVAADAGMRRVEVRTPLLGFVDDLEVRITRADGATRLQVCSHARIGKADFAANQRHIRELLTLLGLQSGAPSP
jgi:uncharacterized protein (DUF1499 family)